MDSSKELTPAQQREARRKLRRIIGDGSPEEQARRVFEKVLTQASKRRTRAAVRTLVNGFGRIILDALDQRRRR
jgi:hypothetical protein